MKRYLIILLASMMSAAALQAQNYVLPWSASQTIESGAKYMISATDTPPAANWYAEDYDASAWTALTRRYYVYNTAAPYCWQRRSFTLQAAPTLRYVLRYSVDDRGCIYVNGNLIEINNNSSDSINITAYLHAGTNVVAGFVEDTGAGATYLDMGVYTTATQQYSGICGRKMNQNTDSTNLRWHLDTFDGVLHITGSGAMRDYTNDTKAPWYPYRAQITRIHVTDSATCIGNMAFYDCYAFDSIYIGDSVKRVGNTSFQSARRLKHVYLNNTRYIQDYAFRYCSALKTADFGNSVESVNYYGFYECPALEEVTNTEGLVSVGYRAFYNDTSLRRILFHEGFQSVDEYSFYNCTSLTSLRFPSTFSTIYGTTFAYCSGLNSIKVDTANHIFDSRNNCHAVMRTSSNVLALGCVNTTIPSTATSIGSYAFCGCNRMEVISIPSSISTIGDYAFQDCSRLGSLVLPEGVVSIGSRSFNSCSSLASVSIPNSLDASGSHCFENCPLIPGPLYNDHLFVFMPRSSVGVYSIPQGITCVSNTAFYECRSITQVTVPEGVGSLLSAAFRNCSMLDTISLPSTLTSIGQYCFYGCGSLRGVHIYDGVRSVPYSCFYDCGSLTSIRLPETLTYIDTYAFRYCRSLLSVHIPDATATIESSAFQDCTGLQVVSIPAALTYMGSGAFHGCTSLYKVIWNAKASQSYSSPSSTPFYNIRLGITDFVFGDSVTVVPKYLCYGMSNIGYVGIGQNVAEVRPFAFEECWGIRRVDWNAKHCNNFEIYDYAPFYPVADSIRSFHFGDSVQFIPAYLCMSMKNLDSLYLPAAVDTICPYAFRGVSGLKSIIVNSNNAKYDSRNQCNALLHTASSNLLLGCRNTVIPANTRDIAEWAFRDVHGLQEAIIPDCVQTIGREAFYGCVDLQTVTLPQGLRRVEDYTFTDCRGLKNILWSDSLQYIGVRGFGHCDSLITMILPATLEQLDKMAVTNCPNMQTMYCLADTVPQIEHNSIDIPCPIYVPCPSLRDYRVDAYWQYQTLYGIYDYRLTTEANDNFFGRTEILQHPDCENDAHILATPASGYEFDRWTDKQTGATFSRDADLVFRMAKNLSLVGNFKLPGEPSGPDEPQSAVEDVEADGFSVRVVGYDIIISSSEPLMVRVIDLAGGIAGSVKVEAEGEAAVRVSGAGIYLVNTTRGTKKVVVK